MSGRNEQTGRQEGGGGSNEEWKGGEQRAMNGREQCLVLTERRGVGSEEEMRSATGPDGGKDKEGRKKQPGLLKKKKRNMN